MSGSPPVWQVWRPPEPRVDVQLQIASASHTPLGAQHEPTSQQQASDSRSKPKNLGHAHSQEGQSNVFCRSAATRSVVSLHRLVSQHSPRSAACGKPRPNHQPCVRKSPITSGTLDPAMLSPRTPPGNAPKSNASIRVAPATRPATRQIVAPMIAPTS
jgi:hypothetical protein